MTPVEPDGYWDQLTTTADPHDTTDDPPTLAQQLTEAARELRRAHDDPDETLREVVKAAIVLIPGTEDASITEVSGRKSLESRAASSELPVRVDALMLEVGEGPCLDALFDERMVQAPEMATDQLVHDTEVALRRDS